MANIRIKDLPSGTPVESKFLAMDLAGTEKATIKDIVYVGRPTASQAEAEAGIDPDKAMTPLTTKQAIDALALPVSAIGSSVRKAAEPSGQSRRSQDLFSAACSLRRPVVTR